MSWKSAICIKYKIIGFFLVLLFTTSCSNNEATSHEDWTLTSAQRDSAAFVQLHHYFRGYNFVLVADSMRLYTEPGGESFMHNFGHSNATLKKGDDFVVADIYRFADINTSTDSVWLKIGSDNIPLGWIGETELLEKAIPTNLISHFIYIFSETRLYIFYVIVLLSFVIIIYKRKFHNPFGLIHCNGVKSLYPTLFCLAISTAAMLYATIQLFTPSAWVEFYFNPSLNPFGQPFLLSIFLFFVWASIIVLISVAFDFFEKISFLDLIAYIIILFTWGEALYIILTLTIKFYFGYALYVTYIFFVLKKVINNHCGEINQHNISKSN